MGGSSTPPDHCEGGGGGGKGDDVPLGRSQQQSLFAPQGRESEELTFAYWSVFKNGYGSWLKLGFCPNQSMLAYYAYYAYEAQF